MTQHIEQLPGFKAIAMLSTLSEGEIWTSADEKLTLTVVSQLYAPCRAVVFASRFKEHYASSRVFLAQQLVALALGDLGDVEDLVVIEHGQPGPSPHIDRYEAPLRRLMASLKPGETPLSIDELFEDVELFVDLAMPDFARATKTGSKSIEPQNEAAYRQALAYFAVKGLLADVARWPQKRQKRASQREQEPNRERPEVVTVPPIDSWMPSDVKPWALCASKELAERVKGRQTTDLLSRETWRDMPNAVMRRLELAGTPTDKTKRVKNAFAPTAESNARYFAVVHFLLNRPI